MIMMIYDYFGFMVQ